MKATLKIRVLLLVFIQLGCKATYEAQKESIHVKEEPLSVILMIGHGMGIAQISTAFYFDESSPNFQRFNSIGFHNSTSTSHWITDSAAGATAFAIGEKTYKRAVGVSQDTLPKETILENLKKQGYQTAIISLTTLTHATPASFYAHVKDRDMHEEIAVQLAGADIDFLAGGGKKYFNQRSDKQDLFKELEKREYHLDTLALSRPIAGRQNAFIIADDGLPAIIDERDDFLKQASLSALDFFEQSNKPFFMMIEGSFIDWGGHAKNVEMMIT